MVFKRKRIGLNFHSWNQNKNHLLNSMNHDKKICKHWVNQNLNHRMNNFDKHNTFRCHQKYTLHWPTFCTPYTGSTFLLVLSLSMVQHKQDRLCHHLKTRVLSFSCSWLPRRSPGVCVASVSCFCTCIPFWVPLPVFFSLLLQLTFLLVCLLKLRTFFVSFSLFLVVVVVL